MLLFQQYTVQKKGNGLGAVLIRFIAITLLRSNGAISKTDWLTGLPKAKQLTKKPFFFQMCMLLHSVNKLFYLQLDRL